MTVPDADDALIGGGGGNLLLPPPGSLSPKERGRGGDRNPLMPVGDSPLHPGAGGGAADWERDHGGHSGVGGGPLLYDPPVPHHGCAECLNCLTLVGGVEGLQGNQDFVSRNSWQILGAAAAAVAALMASTVFFWRQARRLGAELGSDGSSSLPDHCHTVNQHGGEKGGAASERLLSPPLASVETGGGKAARANSLTELRANKLTADNGDDETPRPNGTTARMTNSLGRSATLDPHPPPSGRVKAEPSNRPQASSSAGKRHHHHRHRGQHRKRDRAKDNVQSVSDHRQLAEMVTANILDESELLRGAGQCYFEDDLDPNFVDHRKVGADAGVVA